MPMRPCWAARVGLIRWRGSGHEPEGARLSTPRDMKRVWVTLGVLLLLTGCVAPPRHVAAAAEDAFVVETNECVMVQGASDKVWFSGHQLIVLARRYAEEKKLGFAFEGTEQMVWVKRGGRVLADVWFSSGMGQPVLHVALDQYGQAISHDLGTGVCGTGLK